MVVDASAPQRADGGPAASTSGAATAGAGGHHGGGGPGGGGAHHPAPHGPAPAAPGARQPGEKLNSAQHAQRVVEAARKHAFKKHQVSETLLPPKRSAAPGTALLPMFVDVSRETGDICEQFLWRQNEAGWDNPKAVSQRLMQELGMAGVTYEKPKFDEAVQAALRGLAGWRDIPGGERLVRLQVYVRRGDAVFRDEVDWDVASPTASVLQYTVEVCRHLCLDFDWSTAIQSHVAAMVAELTEDARSRPDDLLLLPPPPLLLRRDAHGAAAAPSSSHPPHHPGHAHAQHPHQHQQQQQHRAGSGALPPAPGSAALAGEGGGQGVKHEEGGGRGGGGGAAVMDIDAPKPPDADSSSLPQAQFARHPDPAAAAALADALASLPPLAAAAAAGPFPRLEAYERSLDVEAYRLARRRVLAERRQQQQPQQAQAQGASALQPAHSQAQSQASEASFKVWAGPEG